MSDDKKSSDPQLDPASVDCWEDRTWAVSTDLAGGSPRWHTHLLLKLPYATITVDCAPHANCPADMFGTRDSAKLRVANLLRVHVTDLIEALNEAENAALHGRK